MNTFTKKTVALLLAAFFWQSMWAQTIPAKRRVNWQEALSSFLFLTPTNQLNVKDFGAVADGQTDNTAAVERAIASLDGRSGEIFFPEGKYFFNSSISLTDSIVLRGEGAQKSVLIFDLTNNATHAIRIVGSSENHFVSLRGGFSKDSRKLICDSASYFHAGDWIEIHQQNGVWNTVPIAWANWSVGQMGRLLGISGDTLILEHPLRIDYTDSLHPQIQRVYPIQNAGIGCLKIKRLNTEGSGAGSNIFFDFSANGHVSGIESDSSVASHVYISHSTQIRIEKSYFHHAFVYDGSNTQGYGVTLAHHSGECLITNNIFVHLRHSMMLKTGANGNVISYNYSVDPFRTESVPDASGDISLHGHYPFSNLIEGNIVQNIIIDHYWGPSGPWNTFFRNRAELYGIIMTESDTTETSFQNFVGNETTNTNFFYGLFALTGSNHFMYGNNILSQIIPSGTDNLPDSSYYLESSPSFWLFNEVWPSVGPPSNLGKGSIPAQLRYLSGAGFTSCSDSSQVFVRKVPAQFIDFKVLPNSETSSIELQFDKSLNKPVYYALFNMSGQKLLEKHITLFNQNALHIRFNNRLFPGIYLIVVQVEKQYLVSKFIIK